MALNKRYFVGEFILGLGDNMYNERVHNRYCRRRRHICAIFQASCANFWQCTLYKQVLFLCISLHKLATWYIIDHFDCVWM